EIWRHLPRESKLKEIISVHMLEIPKVNPLWFDTALLEKWKLVWKVRDIVTRAIEKERIEKIIGDSLEAELIFYVAEEKLYRYLKDKDFTNLSAIFLVSEVKLNRVDKIPPESFRDEELLPNFGIEVIRASGKKCQRCWNYSLSVGEDSLYPDICQRCLKVMAMIKTA
ncbi:MAG: isoleucine--tRNA ligase, partial [Candidatus Omnitrophica bacterium]|nr:isoleucine--tRNA ligase [Candidatus Omnitrophota bacterium]